MSASHLLIVNPRSANGSTGRRWPQTEARLRAILPAFDVAFTQRAGDATRLAAEAAGRYEVIVAVGGDGTINEVVNGLVDDTGAFRSNAALGIVPRGTGSDLVRSLGIPHASAGAAQILARDERRQVDVGRARVLGRDGKPITRCFINEAEVGMGAAVSDAVNRTSKRFGGAASFLWGIVVTMVRYRDCPVSFAVDGGEPKTVVLNNAWIANGRYSGGGMKSAPRAEMDDGLLDLVLIRHTGLPARLRAIFGLRSGSFARLPHVEYGRAISVHVTAATPVPVEVEGELIGTLPATFDVLPERLAVVAPVRSAAPASA